jgi:hypothetical protein
VIERIAHTGSHFGYCAVVCLFVVKDAGKALMEMQLERYTNRGDKEHNGAYIMRILSSPSLLEYASSSTFVSTLQALPRRAIANGP